MLSNTHRLGVVLVGLLIASRAEASHDPVPILPADYIQDAKEVADRRVCLSGYRLAQRLANYLTN